MTDEKIRSADELLFQEESKRMGVTPPPMPEVPKQDLQKTKDEEPTPEEVKPTESLEAEEAEKAPEEHAEKEEIQASDDSLETDDYGNPVSKGKTYTEEEVQRMIRERLARGRNTEQQAQVQEVAADFKADPESDESWETQLGAFVENKINELAQKKEQQKQHDRESQQRTQRAQKKRAAQTRGALHHLARSGDQPGLHLLGGNGGVRLQPGIDPGDPGKLLQIRE